MQDKSGVELTPGSGPFLSEIVSDSGCAWQGATPSVAAFRPLLPINIPSPSALGLYRIGSAVLPTSATKVFSLTPHIRLTPPHFGLHNQPHSLKRNLF